MFWLLTQILSRHSSVGFKEYLRHRTMTHSLHDSYPLPAGILLQEHPEILLNKSTVEVMQLLVSLG